MKQSAYIFDVDGVLNDLHSYETDERITQHMAKLLDNGTFVAVNTGRGYDWVEENVVRLVRKGVQKPDALSRFFVAVEMGGLGIEFIDGKEQRRRSVFSLTDEQIEQVRQVFNAHPEYHDRVGWYEGKETMATLDKRNTTLEAFREPQAQFTTMLRDVFAGQHVKVANSNDAVDVHAPEAGKWAGAQLVYEWLRRVTDIEHDHFVCFGDSALDYEMARFFASQSHNTTFVFTGNSLDVGEVDRNITLVKTEKPYNEGVYEYIKGLVS